MRSLVLALGLILFGCPTPVVADEAKPDLVVTKGIHGRLASNSAPERRRAPWIEIAPNGGRFKEIWTQYVPDEPDEALTTIDFGSDLAVFLLLGPQQTGGYAIEPIEVTIGEGAIRVRARLVQPMSPDDYATEVISAPYAVVRVPAVAPAQIEWIDADGRLLATRAVE